MEWTPLYELRDRLRFGMIAGANLIADDFRLRRAAEAFFPLEKAAPILARLGQTVRALLEPDCPDRAGTLLDAITLCDAILCTQGAVSVPGAQAMEPLEIVDTGGALANAPYSVLAPLQEALTASGGGRYSFVVETHDQRPELFRDYRVRIALVRALGASYAELADKAEQWLIEMGPSVLPLLKSGFDPKGKKDMLRRVLVIDAICKADADDFYRSALPDSEGEVRAALIYALRHSEGNAQFLIERTKTEKGNARKMAFCALVGMENPEIWESFGQSEKMFDQILPYLPHSTTAGAADLVSRALDRLLTPYEQDPDAPMDEKTFSKLQSLLYALLGKSGERVCDLYRRMAALGTSLDHKTFLGENGRETTARFRPAEDSGDLFSMPLSQAIPALLWRAVLENPAPDLLALAAGYAQDENPDFAATALTASLISEPPESAYAAATPYLKPHGVLGSAKKGNSGRAVLLSAMDSLLWTKEWGSAFCIRVFSPADGQFHPTYRPLYGPLDPRWFPDLIRLNGDGALDGLLTALTPLDDRNLCALVGEHLYRHALDGIGLNPGRLSALRRMGWQKCEGLAVACCKAERVKYIWNVVQIVSQLPGDLESRKREGMTVCDLYADGKLALLGGSPETLRDVIDRLKD